MPAIPRRWKYPAAALVACAVLAIGGSAHAAPARPAAHASPGWKLDIPSIGVTAPMLTLGDPKGDVLPVPTLAQAKDAGWYPFTALPGTAGNAVVVGHVDTYTSAAVFYDLYLLVPGDIIYVTADGARQRFKVSSVRMVPKDQFPVNQVFGDTGKHVLWLITCAGDFDYATRHYLDNLIVSAAWQPPKAPKKPHVCHNCHAKRDHSTGGK